MSNSGLVTYTQISPNRNSPRSYPITRITPHCYVAQVLAQDMAGWLCNPNAQASCNYGIGVDGRIGMFVPEGDRSWCSSSSDNDNRAVTIECASGTSSPYAINDKVYNSLINLMVDICQRNGKKKLLWLEDKLTTLNYTPKSDEMILTVHRWFANKECPGEYIYSRLPDIAKTVTEKLGGDTSSIGTGPVDPNWYRVRKSWKDEQSQLGAYKLLENAKKNCPVGYSVYDQTGKVVYIPITENTIKASGIPKSKDDFISKVADIAKFLYKENRIIPSVIIAQCCLETGYGLGSDSTELVKRNNLLGMKSELLNSTWTDNTVWNGESFTKLTPEVIGGVATKIKDSFRVYTDYENCIRDYEAFLINVQSGNGYKYRNKVVGMTDPQQVITAISQGGYATDPSYITKVMKIIEENNLTKYDEEVGVKKSESKKEADTEWDGYFRIQLGAYKDKDNALKKLQEVRKAGFNNAFIVP